MERHFVESVATSHPRWLSHESHSAKFPPLLHDHMYTSQASRVFYDSGKLKSPAKWGYGDTTMIVTKSVGDTHTHTQTHKFNMCVFPNSIEVLC